MGSPPVNRQSAGVETVVQEVVVIEGFSQVPIRRGTSAVRLVSASGYMAGDQRRLGVSVTALTLSGKRIALDDARLGPGWHAIEDHQHRWTDGAALVMVGDARTIGFEAWEPEFTGPA